MTRALLRRTLVRWVRLAGVLVALVTIAAPSVLGVTMSQLGLANEHSCRCGMTPGKCGCPQCARLEQERLRERVPQQVPVVKDGCAPDAPALAFASLPLASIPPGAVRLPAPGATRSPDVDIFPSPPPRSLEPPTPPPRLARA